MAKKAPKSKTFEIVGKEMICPYCGGNNFSNIKNYGSSSKADEKKGVFWFRYQCLDCHAKVIHYSNL